MLANSIEESKKVRKAMIIEALYYRAMGNRRLAQFSLNIAKTEKINQRYFLGGCPF